MEARLPRTLKALVWPPGRLTREWLRGRRASFVSPLRLYLLAAIPFFFLNSARPDEGGAPAGFLEMIAVAPIWTVLSDLPVLEYLPTVDPLAPAADSLERLQWQAEFERRRAYNDSISREREAVTRRGLERVSEVLPAGTGLVMVPVLAVILMAAMPLPRAFIPSLVLSLHLHALGYLAAILGQLVGFGLLLGGAAAGAYLFGFRRREWEERWWSAGGKTAAVIVLYAVVFMAIYAYAFTTAARLAPGWVFGVG